jgi:hypothetical protein
MSTATLRHHLAAVSHELALHRPHLRTPEDHSSDTDARIAIIALLSHATLLERPRTHPRDQLEAARQMLTLIGDPTR